MNPRSINTTSKMINSLCKIGLHRGITYGITSLGVLGGGVIGASAYQMACIDVPERATLKGAVISGVIGAASCGSIGFFGAKYAVPFAINCAREGLRAFIKK